MTDAEHYRAEVGRVLEGKAVVVAMDVLVASARFAEELLDLGAERVLAIGGSRGTGELPDEAKVRCLDLGVRAEGMMEGIRAAEAALDALPAHARAELDAFDPDGTALAIRSPFSTGKALGGRPVFGAREDPWMALENKMTVDALWDEAGVPRAPSRVLALEDDRLVAEAQRVDEGHGTVWVADNREGWHGGAEHVRWVRTRREAEAARRFLGERADRVRVMPFLEGIPCSIHAFVLTDAVVVLRPCEMLVFRNPGEGRFVYGAAATYWTPRREDAEEMRAIARRVGRHVRRTVGYRGCLTIDGVMTEDGFRPTELNPRFGGAVAALAAGIRVLPLYLLHLAMVEGIGLDYRPDELELVILGAAAEHPRARSHRMLSVTVATERTAGLVADPAGIRFAEADETPHIDVTLGPSVTGGVLLLLLRARPPSISPGAPVAPLMAEAYRFLDREWSLGLGPLQAAREMRPALSPDATPTWAPRS